MSVRILITGDFCPINRIGDMVKNNEYHHIFNEFIDISKSADLAITNLECPLTNCERPIQKTGPALKSYPNALKALKFAGFDTVTLANNHILDYGEEGLRDTIENCMKEGIQFVGAGKNLDEARKPLYFELKDKKIAVYNVAENEFGNTYGDQGGANPLNPVVNFYDLKEAKRKVDFLLVIIHGGREHYPLPSPQTQAVYRFFIDNGADAVIAHHTHCYSGYEIYHEKPIFYSLGNFIFDYKKKYQKGLWVEGYAVQINLDKDRVGFDLIPFYQGREKDPSLKLFDTEERNKFDQRISGLNNIIGNMDLLKENWSDYLLTQEVGYKGLLFIKNKYIREAMRRKYLPAFFFDSKEHNLILLNLLRCEAHREIMIKTLENNFKD